MESVTSVMYEIFSISRVLFAFKGCISLYELHCCWFWGIPLFIYLSIFLKKGWVICLSSLCISQVCNWHCFRDQIYFFLLWSVNFFFRNKKNSIFVAVDQMPLGWIVLILTWFAYSFQLLTPVLWGAALFGFHL